MALAHLKHRAEKASSVWGRADVLNQLYIQSSEKQYFPCELSMFGMFGHTYLHAVSKG